MQSGMSFDPSQQKPAENDAAAAAVARLGQMPFWIPPLVLEGHAPPTSPDRSTDQRPWYEVLEQSSIDLKMFHAGAQVQYDGLPAGNLRPLNRAGMVKAAEFEESNKHRLATLSADAKAMSDYVEQKANERHQEVLAALKANGEAMANAFERALDRAFEAQSKGSPKVKP